MKQVDTFNILPQNFLSQLLMNLPFLSSRWQQVTFCQTFCNYTTQIPFSPSYNTNDLSAHSALFGFSGTCIRFLLGKYPIFCSNFYFYYLLLPNKSLQRVKTITTYCFSWLCGRTWQFFSFTYSVAYAYNRGAGGDALKSLDLVAHIFGTLVGMAGRLGSTEMLELLGFSHSPCSPRTSPFAHGLSIRVIGLLASGLCKCPLFPMALGCPLKALLGPRSVSWPSMKKATREKNAVSFSHLCLEINSAVIGRSWPVSLGAFSKSIFTS